MTPTRDAFLEAPLSTHVEALRSALLSSGAAISASMLLLFCFRTPLFALLTATQPNVEWVVLSPLEGFLVGWKLSFWGGFVLSSPVWLWSGAQFISPALYAREKQWSILLIATSYLSLLLGIAVALHWTLPLTNAYLAAFNAPLGANHWSVAAYVGYVLFLLLGHAILAEWAVILFFCVHFRFFSGKMLKKKRRVFYPAAFVVAALVTPPDVLTQCLVAIPAVCFYEMAILYAKWREKATILEEQK